jgi:hypothetical protein
MNGCCAKWAVVTPGDCSCFRFLRSQSSGASAASEDDEHNVADQDRPVGIVTDRRLALAVYAQGLSRPVSLTHEILTF